jgi:holo-[acyl-carrier protein] synthase
MVPSTSEPPGPRDVRHRGLGIDMVHIPTLRRIMSRRRRFADVVFTAHERTYCQARGDQQYQHFAARFAAKEAFVKATQAFWLDWSEVEIRHNAHGGPYIHTARAVCQQQTFAVSLTHAGEYAIAVV